MQRPPCGALPATTVDPTEDQMQRLSIVITALTTLVGPSLAQSANPKRPGTTVIVYDDFHKPGGYTLADYDAKWSSRIRASSTTTASRFPRRPFGPAKTPASPITASTWP